MTCIIDRNVTYIGRYGPYSDSAANQIRFSIKIFEICSAGSIIGFVENTDHCCAHAHCWMLAGQKPNQKK